MQLLVVEDELAGAHEGIAQGQKVGDGWAHRIVVLGEESLEHAEVVLSHLVYDLVESRRELYLRVVRVACHIENGDLESLCDHIIALQDFLGKDGEDRVDLFVVNEPKVLKLEKLAHQQVTLLIIQLVCDLFAYYGVLVLFSETEVGDFVVALDLEALVGVGLDHGDIVLFRNFDFDTHRILGLSVVVTREMDTDDSLHLLLIILIFPKEVLDVLVLSQWEL